MMLIGFTPEKRPHAIQSGSLFKRSKKAAIGEGRFMTNLSFTHLTLGVEVEGDEEDVERATRQLRDEIRDLPIESVELERGGVAPAGSKTGELLVLGSLAVQLAPLVMPPLVDFLKTWVTRKEGRSVVVKRKVGDRLVELRVNGGVSRKDIESFLRSASVPKA